MTSRKIKVVFGVNDFLVGGMQRQFAEQLRFFNRNRFEIILVTLFDFPGAPALYKELPSDLEVHRLAFTGMFDVASWWRLYRLLRQIKPDIVVSSLFFSNLIFRKLKPVVGYVSIAREHNTYIDRSAWQRFSDRLLASRSYRIIAVSRTVAAFTAKQEGIPFEKFTVIHNGIDAERMQERLETLPDKTRLKEERGFQPSSKLLIAVSRLMPQKNHRLLLKGFALFRRSHPDYRLAVVGGGSLRASLEQEAQKLGITDALAFFGHQDDPTPFYKMADALVSTSDIEGLSNSMLEALAAGVPLVATKTAGTDELIEDGKNGYFVEDRTPEGVNAALERFDKADQTKMGDICRATARAFDIRETVRAYESLFSSIIA